MDEPLQCAICMSDFTQPKQLPCFHSFCLNCLTEYCKEEIDGDMKPCPLCRRAFCIPQGGVIEFRNDEIIERLLIEKKLKERSLRQGIMLCEVCDDEVEAKFFCTECKQNLCGRCKSSHVKVTSTRNHRLVGLEERPSEIEIERMKSSYCVGHEKEEIKLYCCDCKMLLCVICHATGHTGHKCQIPYDVAKIKKKLSSKDNEALERCREESMRKISIVDEIKAQCESLMLNNREEIASARSKCLECIANQTYILQNKVDHFETERKKEVDSQREFDHTRYVELDSFISHSRMVMERGTDCEIIRVADELHKRAEELINKQDEYNKQVLTERSVTFVPSADPNQKEIFDMLGSFLYRGEWKNKEFELSPDIEAHWRGSAETVEMILTSLSRAFESCHCHDIKSKIDEVLKRLQVNVKQIEGQNQVVQKLNIDADIFEHLNSATMTLSENYNQFVKGESQLNSIIKQLANQINTLECENKSSKTEIDALKFNEDTLTTKNNLLQAELQRAKADKHQQLIILEKTKNKAKQQLGELTSKLQNSESESKRRTVKLENSNTKLLDEIEILKTKLADASLQIGELTSKLQNSESESKRRTEELEDSNTKLLDEIESLKTTLEKTKAETSQQIDDLTSKFQEEVTAKNRIVTELEEERKGKLQALEDYNKLESSCDKNNKSRVDRSSHLIPDPNQKQNEHQNVYVARPSGKVTEDGSNYRQLEPGQHQLFKNSQGSECIETKGAGVCIQNPSLSFEEKERKNSNEQDNCHLFSSIQDIEADEGKNLALYEKKSLKSLNLKELKSATRILYLRCPCKCDTNNKSMHWHCFNCLSLIQCDTKMNHFFCQCGTAPKSSYSFKCKLEHHGDKYIAFSQEEVNANSEKFIQKHYVNILILGETGVGKSTWINSIANYFTHATLQEAADAKELLVLIRSSFTMTDEARHQRRIVLTTKYGKDDNEANFDDGASSTQEPVMYEFQYGDLNVRLIDTPGLGDIRGIKQDKENFDAIMNCLRSLDELHGICILLKPNNSKLTIGFKFCISEVLTHLHHDAAKNIVFCFTNTRATFYRPGDTIVPLRNFLSTIKAIQGFNIDIACDTTYCIDNEPFRFLCAIRNNFNFCEQQRDNFTESWGISKKETERLIRHIERLSPHKLIDSVSLNDARNIVLNLAGPISDVLLNKMINLRILKDQRKKMEQEWKKEPKMRMELTVVELHIEELEHSTAFCANKSCTKVEEIWKDLKQIQYTRDCNQECYIEGVNEQNSFAEAFNQCQASVKIEKCNSCNCNMDDHLHSPYRLMRISKTKTIAADCTLAEIPTGYAEPQIDEVLGKLDMFIKEIEMEIDILTEISARFGYFLRCNAIVSYDDAFQDYFDSHIKIEKAHFSKRYLNQIFLETMKSNYEQSVHEHNQENVNIKETVTPDDINRMREELYAMKVDGEKIKMLYKLVTQARVQIRNANVINYKETLKRNDVKETCILQQTS